MQNKLCYLFKKSTFAAVLVAAMTTQSGVAFAGSATSTLPVSATVAASCTIDASSGIAFGMYDPIVANSSTALAGSGTINTTCTNGSDATVTLGQGANAGSGSTDASPLRRMLSGTTNYLSYNLYTDAAFTTVWNNTTGTTVTGTGAQVSTTVYGQVTAAQNVAAGSYADTVIATVTF
ncbi:Csu type fimbrial protein [Rhodanobacter umsongensis]